MSTENEAQLPAVAPRATLLAPTNDLSVARLCDPSVPEGTRILSTAPDSPYYEPLIIGSEEPGAKEAKQFEQEPFRMVAWLAKAVSVEAQDGSGMVRSVRVTLMNDDGDCVSTTSQGVADSLDLIRHLRGDGPYDPPLSVVYVNVRTKRGRTMTRLRLK